MTEEWIKKMWYIYTMEYYSVIKKNGLPWGSDGKESTCNVGDLGWRPEWIPRLGRSLGEGNGYPLQYSCLENSKDRGMRLTFGTAFLIEGLVDMRHVAKRLSGKWW